MSEQFLALTGLFAEAISKLIAFLYTPAQTERKASIFGKLSGNSIHPTWLRRIGGDTSSRYPQAAYDLMASHVPSCETGQDQRAGVTERYVRITCSTCKWVACFIRKSSWNMHANFKLLCCRTCAPAGVFLTGHLRLHANCLDAEGSLISQGVSGPE